MERKTQALVGIYHHRTIVRKRAADVAGIGGVTNATFIMFTQMNAATPLASWTPIPTNQFDQYGVSFKSNVSGRYEPQRYFHLLQK